MVIEENVKMDKKDKEMIKKVEKGETTKMETPKKVKKEEKPKEKEAPKKERPKKSEAFVSISNLPISTKHAKAVCKFIKNKKIPEAIADLEQVLKFKKSIPMKGEIPHRKGKGMMSGRFVSKTTETFIRLLKSLSANANYNGLEDPVIVEAIANIGARPYGRFGWVRKKRTHVKIVAKDKQKTQKNGRKKRS
jgi:large subunit ribosomal protein L22